MNLSKYVSAWAKASRKRGRVVSVFGALLIGLLVASIAVPASAAAQSESELPVETQPEAEVPVETQSLSSPSGDREFVVRNGERVRINDAAGTYEVAIDGQNFGPVRQSPDELQLRNGSINPSVDGGQFADRPRATVGTPGVFIVQLETHPLASYRDDMELLGAVIHSYIPDNAYLIEMPADVRDQVEALPFVKSTTPFGAPMKIDSALDSTVGSGEIGTVRYSILLLDAEASKMTSVTDEIVAAGGTVDFVSPLTGRLEATLSPAMVDLVLSLDEVEFMDLWSAPESDVDNARVVGGANELETVQGYDGSGVTGVVIDSGLFEEHAQFASSPPVVVTDTTDDAHGTWVYGVVFASGSPDSRYRGILPAGRGIFASHRFGTIDRALLTAELVDPDGPYRAVFQTNSWGGARATNYTTRSVEMDEVIFNNDILILQSQSNSGTQMSRPEAWAKNVVSVGGIRHADNLVDADDVWAGNGDPLLGITSNASIGPASDGRVKPDLSFWYDNLGTTGDVGANSYFDSFGGTSGATPLTAGYFGLLFEMWADGVFEGTTGLNRDVFDSRPHAATAKALAINTAFEYDFAGTTADLTRTHQGWGRIDMGNAYDTAKAGGIPIIVDETDLLTPADVNTYTVTTGAGAECVMRATMAYTDVPGTPAAAIHRINDLSLRVTSPFGTTYWGNNGLLAGNWSTPAGTSNTIDTVENVFVNNLVAGTWTIEVLGDIIAEDSHVETPALDADYALVVSSNCLEAEPEPDGCVIQDVAVETYASKLECEALVALYVSTNGASWTTNTGWNTSTDPCSWFGVICSQVGVREVLLPDNELGGTLPVELGNLINLTKLFLNSNQVGGAIPAELGNLSNLTDLTLFQNQLSGPVPASLGNLTNLTTMYLNANQLTGPIPAELGNLSNLSQLNLSTNLLTEEIPASLGELESLTQLLLSQNQLSGEIPSQLGDLGNLTRLHLSFNLLTGEIPDGFDRMTNLNELVLNHNMLSGTIPGDIGQMDNLTKLLLSHNLLTGDLTAAIGGTSDTLQQVSLADGPGLNYCFTTTSTTVRSFLNFNDPQWAEPSAECPTPASGCVIQGVAVETVASQAECDALVALFVSTNGAGWVRSAGWNTATDPCGWIRVTCNADGVARLSLYGNQLTGVIPPEIGDLLHLTHLYLNRNGLTGTIPGEIGMLDKLTGLFLSDNQLTGVLPEELGDLESVRYLWLKNNLLTGDLTAAIAGTMDTLRVVRLGDGPGFNDCFTTTSTAVGNFLDDEDLGWDECDTQVGTIGDFVFFDRDGNGEFNLRPFVEDQPMPDVTVVLREAGQVVAVTVTDSNGAYLFENVALGIEYQVEVDHTTLPPLLEAWIQTTGLGFVFDPANPGSGTTASTTTLPVAGQADPTSDLRHDFGYTYYSD